MKRSIAIAIPVALAILAIPTFAVGHQFRSFARDLGTWRGTLSDERGRTIGFLSLSLTPRAWSHQCTWKWPFITIAPQLEPEAGHLFLIDDGERILSEHWPSLPRSPVRLFSPVLEAGRVCTVMVGVVVIGQQPTISVRIAEGSGSGTCLTRGWKNEAIPLRVRIDR